MNTDDKIKLLQSINNPEILPAELFYDVLEKCGDLKNSYFDYMVTQPIDCNMELLRLPTANYDLCCALLAMLLNEDCLINGSFEKRQRQGQVKPIVERMLHILFINNTAKLKSFSEKSRESLNGFYVYALIDPRDEKIFYIGKGTGDRVFSHEAESAKVPNSERAKLRKIKEIENSGFAVKRVIVNWGLTEDEAFASEASLINLNKYIPDIQLTNEVSGHHVHEALSVEDFELQYGAIPLKQEDIKHSILVIKINKLYRRNMTEDELYDVVRGYWNASLRSIETRKVEYVFGVYNGLIVAVYKPDEWHHIYENIDAPQHDILTEEDYERLKNRVYFICKDYKNIDENGRFYLHKSILDLKASQSSQNPITYLSPDKS